MMRSFMASLLLVSLASAQSTPIGSTKGGTGNNISFVQACNHNQTSSTSTFVINIGSSGTCSAGLNPAAGDLVVVAFASGNIGSITGKSDTLGNTWTCATGNSNLTVKCHSILTTGGSADSVTITTQFSSPASMISLELSGVVSSSSQDGSNQFNQPASSTSWTLASLTTTNANDVVIGCAGTIASTETYTAGSGYTIPTDGQVSGSGISGFCEYQIVTATGTYSPTVTLTSAIAGRAVTLGFKSQ